jgi:hypothetical protein
MTAKDAASLLCAVSASETVQDSVSTLLALKALQSWRQGVRMRRPAPHEDPSRAGPLFTLGLEPSHSVIDGLAAAIGVFDREEEFLRQIAPPKRRGEETGIYATFYVQYPAYFASLTVGVHGRFSEVWVYGRREKPKFWQTRGSDENALREIAACLRKS